MIKRIYPDSTIIVCGTGPSITQQQIDLVNKSDAKVIGCNRAYQIFNIDVLHGCNYQFWKYWWHDIKDKSFLKYTTRPELKGEHEGLEYIREKWIDGLSIDPNYIAAHHGTGPQAVNLAYLMGAKTILLVGWDMRFPGKIDDRTYTEKRRYLGEDPLTEKHWPRTAPNGDLAGLIKEMETIKPEDYGVNIINCTPNSAMTCFPMMELSEALETYAP